MSENKDRCITFLMSKGQKATSELQLTNKTDDFLVFRVKSNAPDLFTISPSATGIVKPHNASTIKLHLRADIDDSLDYRFLIQSIYLQCQDVDADVDAQNLWNQEIGKNVRKVTNSRLAVKIVHINSPTEIESVSVLTMGDQPHVKATAEMMLQAVSEAEKGDRIHDEKPKTTELTKTLVDQGIITGIKPTIQNNFSTDYKVWLPSVMLFVGYAVYYQLLPGF